MIKVDMWELVRDWVSERYDYVKVSKFRAESIGNHPVDHLGHITVERPGEDLIEIGFVAPKGVLVWKPYDVNDKVRKFDYSMFLSTDPQMFEKLEKMLNVYEPKRSK